MPMNNNINMNGSHIAQELIKELFAGKTVQKQEIMKAVDREHLKRGGKPSMARFHHPVTLALSNMRQHGSVENPNFGYWSILPDAPKGEEVGPERTETEVKELLEITTLNEFMEWTQQLAPEEYLFRGVPNADYEIEASAYRRPKKEDRDFEKFLRINKELIKDARLQGLDVIDGRELKDLEILAEFQHYRAATCLIDFTYSAQVALWFACGQDSDDPSDGKVFAVRNKPPKFKEVTPDLLKEGIDYFLQDNVDERSQQYQSQSKQLYQWRPRQLNNRIGAQQSIFLFGDFKIDPNEKCIIIGDSKQDIRTALQQGANITEAMLFPDFDGFARLRSHNVPYTQLSASEYRERADLAYQRQEYTEAIADYDMAIQLDPDDPQAYFNRGLVRIELGGQHEDALADFDKAIDLNPNNADAYNNRGGVKVILERFDEALTDYDEAIRLNPEHVLAYYHRGILMNHLGRIDEATQDIQKTLQLAAQVGDANFIVRIGRFLDEINSRTGESQ